MQSAIGAPPPPHHHYHPNPHAGLHRQRRLRLWPDLPAGPGQRPPRRLLLRAQAGARAPSPPPPHAAACLLPASCCCCCAVSLPTTLPPSSSASLHLLPLPPSTPPPHPPPQSPDVSVFTAYQWAAYQGAPAIASPWFGSTGVKFIGDPPSAGGYDSGAVRVDNTRTDGKALNISAFAVTLPGWGVFRIWDAWLPLTLAPGERAIFVQSGG